MFVQDAASVSHMTKTAQGERLVFEGADALRKGIRNLVKETTGKNAVISSTLAGGGAGGIYGGFQDADSFGDRLKNIGIGAGVGAGAGGLFVGGGAMIGAHMADLKNRANIERAIGDEGIFKEFMDFVLEGVSRDRLRRDGSTIGLIGAPVGAVYAHEADKAMNEKK